MEYIFKIEKEYKVSANSEDEAYCMLEEIMHDNNSDANSEFWDNLKVIKVITHSEE